jgi:hypothetical protein
MVPGQPQQKKKKVSKRPHPNRKKAVCGGGEPVIPKAGSLK